MNLVFQLPETLLGYLVTNHLIIAGNDLQMPLHILMHQLGIMLHPFD